MQRAVLILIEQYSYLDERVLSVSMDLVCGMMDLWKLGINFIS